MKKSSERGEEQNATVYRNGWYLVWDGGRQKILAVIGSLVALSQDGDEDLFGEWLTHQQLLMKAKSKPRGNFTIF